MGLSLRTLHVDTERTWRGGEQQVLYLATGLRERGHVAEIACQPRSPLAERARSAGLTLREIRMRGESDPVAVVRLALRVARGRYDIVHSHTAHAHTLVGFALSLCFRRPRHVVARRVISPIGGGLLRGLKYRRPDCYIAISNAVKQALLDGGVPEAKVRVVSSCVDLSRFDDVDAGALRSEFGLPSEAVLIVSVGFLVELKGHEYLIDAMPSVIGQVPHAYCVLVGEGERRPDLEARARKLGLADRIVFAGFRADALRFLKAADVSVMPSLEEGLGNSVLETLALRRPLVVTDAGGLPEVVEDGVSGLVVPRGNAAALADGILRALRDPEAAARRAEAGRHLVEERFTRPRLIDGTLQVYRELLVSR